MRVFALTVTLAVAGAFHAPAAYMYMQKTCVSAAHSRALTTTGARSTLIMAKEVVVKEDYRVAASFAVTGLAILFAPTLVGGFLTVLGMFLVFQTFRIRFVFDGEAIEVKTKPLGNLFSTDLGATGENFAVGGENRWALSSVVNWEFFPSEQLPILVYFKEIQTPADKWDVGPGKWANGNEALQKGAVKGQVHFFPCIADAQAIKAGFVRGGAGKL